MLSTAAALTASRGFGRVADSVGLELYSLRDEMKNSVPKTLATVRRMGFTDVEVPGLYGLTATDFRKELDRAGLKCSAVVVPWDRLRDDLRGGLSDAGALGAKYVICPWIPHDKVFTLADVDTAAENFGSWGRECAAQGLVFCYHPHGYEFGFMGNQTMFDTLARSTNSKTVKFELDIFWVVRGGENPVSLLRKHEGRFPLVHLKDLKKGTPTGDLTGNAPDDTSVALGKGLIDIPSILKACAEEGVAHYYIEDESPDAARQIPESLAYLRSLGV
jgi:sugar phosphate isomerase/epimerase